MEVSIVNAKANYTVTKVQELCEKLYLAAKNNKTRRFHALYDKVYRFDVLKESWERVKENKGVAGIDNENISDIIEKGEATVLVEIAESLLEGKYRPRSVKRVTIPKSDGRERHLGIPTVRDRIVQTAVKILLEPIFEADFLDCSYGFRPGRSTHNALEVIRQTTNKGKRIVLDADIKGFFDNIDHDKLMEFLQKRVSDRRILKLIRKWLRCGVLVDGEYLKTEQGTPQGGVISPLLANIYLHELDRYWAEQVKVPGTLVRYCDDFVIMFHTPTQAQYAFELVKDKLADLGLELNENKTRIVNLYGGKEGFDFLGFYHCQVKSKKYKRYYTQKWPSKKAMKSIRQEIRIRLAPRSILNQDIDGVVAAINPILCGWMNYFCHGNSTRKFSQVDNYVHERLALWWSKKHHKSGRRWMVDFNKNRYKKCGVYQLSGNIRYWSNDSNAGGRRT